MTSRIRLAPMVVGLWVALCAGASRMPSPARETANPAAGGSAHTHDAAHRADLTQDSSAEIAILGISPDPVDRGQVVTITYQVTNTGSTARAFSVRIYIDSMETGGTVYERWQWTDAIEPGGSETLSLQDTVPPYWAFGSYLAVAEVHDVVTIASGQRGFSVLHLKEGWQWVESVVPDPVTLGRVATITCQIYSHGNYPTTFDIAVDIAQYGDWKANVGLLTTDLMYPGDTFTMVFDYTIPGDWTPGLYQVCISKCPGAPTPNCSGDFECSDFTIRAARTIHVDCSNDTGVEDGTEANPFNTIQEGIAAALDGDTVLVQPCTYYETIDFLGKAITVTSTDPLDPAVVAATIIQGGGVGRERTVTFANGEGADSALRGFTVTHESEDDGGGILCVSCSPTIANNVINGNRMGYAGYSTENGGGIACYDGGSPTIVDNTVTGNQAACGGGIWCCLSSPTIANNTISGNDAGEGGGIYLESCAPTISNNTIDGNWAFWGSGVHCNASSPEILGNVITNNHMWVPYGEGGGGGGIYCCNDSSPTIAGNSITGNEVYGGGGGIYSLESSPTMTDNTITDNSASRWGGGIWCGFSSPTIASNTIEGNDGATMGGGIYCLESSGTTCDNTISDNTAVWGCGIFCDAAAPTIVSNVISGNVGCGYFPFPPNDGRGGGGIACLNGSSPTITENAITGNYHLCGGGILCDASSPTIFHNTITANEAGDGGGILCRDSSPTITDNAISGNYADDCYGGGICCVYSPAIIASNTITGNVVRFGSPEASAGGGIACLSSSPTVVGNIIAQNSAPASGGGIYCESSSATLTNNTIADNSTMMPAGGAIYCLDSSPTMANNIVAPNSWGVATDSGSPILRNNCVYNPEGDDYLGIDPGEGDFSADPLFVDAAGGDYHLTAVSPCINAGWNEAPQLPDSDIDGEPRVHDDTVDIGADEAALGPTVRWCFSLSGIGWHMISLPGYALDPDPWEVFDELRPPSKTLDLLSGSLYRYDQDTLGYVMYPSEGFGPVTPGDGYWLWLGGPETICYEAGRSADSLPVHMARAGWHLMGSPQAANAHVSTTSWYYGQLGPHPFSTVTQPGELCWVGAPLYSWSPLTMGYQPVGLQPWEEHSLRPFRGYWLYTFVDDVTLEMQGP